MKGYIIIVLLCVSSLSYSLTVSNTYTAGDIPTSFGGYDPGCNGVATPLNVVLPAGGPWVVTSVDVSYNMTSTTAGGGWMSEQRSRLACQNSGLDEGNDFSGIGNNGGTQNYNRTGLGIANGQYNGGTTLIFELPAFRTWAGTAGCNTTVTLIDNGSWEVIVNYELAVPMTYVTSNTIQTPINTVQDCFSSTEVILIEVETSGTLTPLELTTFNLTTNGTSNLGEIGNVHIYYTGIDGDFSTLNLFGSTVSGGNLVVSGGQLLEEGINYFWVEYELISPTQGNVIDGECTNFVLGGNTENPLVISPVGFLTVESCTPYPGGVSTDLTLWLDAEVNYTSPSWTAKNDNGFVYTETANATTVSPNSINFNDAVYFNASPMTSPSFGVLSGDKDFSMYCVSKDRGSGANGAFGGWTSLYGFSATAFSRYDVHVASNSAGVSQLGPTGQGVFSPTQYAISIPNLFDIDANTNNATSSFNANGTTSSWSPTLVIPEAVSGIGARGMLVSDVAEIVVFSNSNTPVDKLKIQSYLAVKYGITLGVNGVSIDYLSSNETVIWEAVSNANFAFDVAGIALDDASGLDQPKSHSINEDGFGGYNDILTVANGINFSAPTSITTNLSSFMWGNNGLNTVSTGASVVYSTDNGETIGSIFDRVWKGQETGDIAVVELEFDMSNSFVVVGGSAGNVDYSTIRLLVDEDGDFSTGATAYSPSSFDAATNKVYFQHDFTPTDGNAMTPNNGYFFTLASVENIVANFAMSDTTICVGESITFSDSSYNNPMSWAWTFNGGDITIENTQGPHIVTFSTPGTYGVTLEVSDANGTDDSTLQVIVDPRPIVDAGLNDAICLGEDYTLTAINSDGANLNWTNSVIDGVLFTPVDSLMYYVTAELNGCENIDSVIIDVNFNPELTVPLDFSICEGEGTLVNATSTSVGTIISWDNGVVNDQLFIPNITTIYTAIATITTGVNVCTTTDEIEITVNEFPTIDAGLDDIICDGENYTLIATNPSNANLTWTNGITDGDEFMPIDSMIYHVTAELNGCESLDSVIVDVIVNPDLTVPLDFSICEGEGALLNATTASESTLITWDNGVVNNQSFIPLNTNVYTATASVSTGGIVCTTTDVLTVIVNPIPVIEADASGQTLITVCAGAPYTLMANNPDGALINWNNGVVDNIEFTPIDSLMYYVVADLNGCVNVDSIVIDAIDSPNVLTELDQSICIGDSVLLHATTNQIAATLNWNNSIPNDTYIFPTTSQTYTATATLGNCSSSDDFNVTVMQLPDVGFSFSPNPVTTEDTEVQFTQINIENDELYYWSFGDNSVSTQIDPVHIYAEIPGVTYYVELTVISDVGCVNSLIVPLLVNDELVYFVPNAFTPDGDEFNETFQPVFTSGFNPYDYHLLIFNRWGEVVFESYNDQIGWDGSYAGEKVQDGTYIWKIWFGDALSDKKYVETGTVTILK